MMYKIRKTEQFKRQFKKLSKPIKNRFKRQLNKICINPFGLGKPISRSYFREVKNKGYRLYYLIFKDEIIVLLIGVSDKKYQQGLIDNTLTRFELYKFSVKEKKYK